MTQIRSESKLVSASLSDADKKDKNPYYCNKFGDYLVRSFLPFTPMLTYLTFEPTQDQGAEDHQVRFERVFIKRGTFVTSLSFIGRCRKLVSYIETRGAWIEGDTEARALRRGSGENNDRYAVVTLLMDATCV